MVDGRFFVPVKNLSENKEKTLFILDFFKNPRQSIDKTQKGLYNVKIKEILSPDRAAFSEHIRQIEART